MTPQQLSYLIAGVGLVIVVGWQLLRLNKAKRLRLERLWIVPALYSVFAAGLYWYQPPQGWEWAIAAAALAGGAGVGWLRGSTMRIAVDPVTHDLNQRQSPAAIALIAVLVLVRFAVREEFVDPTHINPGILDAFVAFAVGLLSMQRLEMFLRARRLLGEARAAR